MVHQIMLGIERSVCTLVKKPKVFVFLFARYYEHLTVTSSGQRGAIF
jgi:hypothetical protein